MGKEVELTSWAGIVHNVRLLEYKKDPWWGERVEVEHLESTAELMEMAGMGDSLKSYEKVLGKNFDPQRGMIRLKDIAHVRERRRKPFK